MALCSGADNIFDDFMSTLAMNRALLAPEPPRATIHMKGSQYMAIARRVRNLVAVGAITEERLLTLCEDEPSIVRRGGNRLLTVEYVLAVASPSPNPWRPERRVLGLYAG